MNDSRGRKRKVHPPAPANEFAAADGDGAAPVAHLSWWFQSSRSGAVVYD